MPPSPLLLLPGGGGSLGRLRSRNLGLLLGLRRLPPLLGAGGKLHCCRQKRLLFFLSLPLPPLRLLPRCKLLPLRLRLLLCARHR